ncbi:UDP-N-acetylmuramoyl-L-alanyl-D-glutamate--2,6-diaminopimelate ligase [Acetobacteraceae bacterium]|nr:UDP-N-acetylmuramoyl-L-alanyl-D-glutamate--2,6-diaminopimelate ligase [Acetobacteraceae bacterium]
MQLSSLIPSNLLPDTYKNVEISSISSDSREIQKGALFFALSGTKLDGTAFIQEAISKGAAAIVSEKDFLPQEDIPIVIAKNAASLLGICSYKFQAPLPDHIIAITGTNGKTSTADFIRQLWELKKENSASIGTLGIKATTGDIPSAQTTPPPTLLAKYLHQLKKTGVEHIALEASSHGLVQNRLTGLTFEAAGFSSFSRDHLDYHKTEEAYLNAKLTLFKDLLKPGAPVAASTACGEKVLTTLQKIAEEKKSDFRTIGKNGNFFNILKINPLADGQELFISFKKNKPISIHLPIPGLFQAQNALLAAALICPNHTTTQDAYELLQLFSRLKPIPGRAELAGKTENGAAVYIDYAHTPDAIERIIESLRPHLSEKGRLFILFGAGGNRDSGKRPLMGKAASLADISIVTDDNPRFEDPKRIREEILSGYPKAIEIAGRKEAISYALKQLKSEDILVIAGKGHEKGQEVNGKTLPFDDLQTARQEGKLMQGNF